TEDPQSKQVLLQYSNGKPQNYLEGRTQFHSRDFSLEILNTSRQDGQLYEYVTSKGQEEKVWQIQLEVYEPVSHPSIEVLSRALANGSCSLTLKCSARGDNISYGWACRPPGLCSPRGSLLHLSYPQHNSSVSCSCSATNPVSSHQVTFSAPGCSPEPAGRCPPAAFGSSLPLLLLLL
ncbi:SLAF1 protein, partial [Indicator maculatus]|nr:SLAF1 protein [Indicator maculatus]